MDTNRAMPPQSPSQQGKQGGSAPPEGKNTDLYTAIVGEVKEEEILAPIKKKQPFMMSLVVLFMKTTFYFDSVRRTNESFFNFLGGIWHGFMFLIYVGGLSMLCMSIYARMKLPLELENFFESHNLKYDSLKMADYSLSRILVINLHDEKNQYVIPQLNIHSTFSDFLQGRIRTVTVEGLQLNIKSDGANGDSLQGILKTLGLIANPMEMGLGLEINSVTINNAVLNIEGQGTKIPVNFSMSGLYADNARVIIPFVVEEDFLKMDASLDISGPFDNRELALTIKSGMLTLPNRSPEEMQGLVNIQISSDKIVSLQSQINLNYGYNLKTIEVKLDNADQGFKGDISFALKNTSEKDSRPLVDLSLGVEGLLVSKDGFVTTSEPLQMKINRLVRNTTILEGVEGTLNGDLNCNLSQMECHYNLIKETFVRYQNLALKYKGQNVVIDDSGNILFRPSSDTVFLRMKDSFVGLNWVMAGVDLNGFYNQQANTLHMTADEAQLSGHFSTQVDQDFFDIKVKDGAYQTPPLTMKGIDLVADDLYNPTAPIYFSAKEVTTSSFLLTRPVSVDMTYLNRQVKANVHVKDTSISLEAEGILQPFQKTFVGQFKMPAIELKNLPFDLSDLSSIFPKNLKKPSGQIVASGRLHFAGGANISGPLYVGLKNVSFNLDEVPVERVNAVIALQSLVPLVSAPNQNVFIGKINSFIPLTNINGLFQLENQSVRLLGINADLAGQDLSVASALIPYRKPNALLHLKTGKDFDISTMLPFINLAGFTPVGGTGTLSVPVDVSEKGIEMSSATLKVNNVTLKQIPDKTDVLGLFQQGNKAYMIRNGQLIFTKGNQLQVDLDGWLMPMRKREAFAQKDVSLDKPLFKAGKINPVPQKIQDRQKLLFQTLMEESTE